MTDPSSIARRLIDLAKEVDAIEVDVDSFPLTGMEERHLSRQYELHHHYVQPARYMLDELQDALAGANWDPDLPDVPKSEHDRWTFGTMMTIKGALRAIHRGFLQPLRRVPILTHVPERVALYLITIDEGEDYLKNETHSGVGWHYHYLDRRKLRSDVVLCWDTRWKGAAPPTNPPARRGLFVEKHAERGKEITAKPEQWGPKKRETMYYVCSADLRKRHIGEYRCAANKSMPVYPLSATLTPHPAHAATATVNPPPRSNKKGKKRRR